MELLLWVLESESYLSSGVALNSSQILGHSSDNSNARTAVVLQNWRIIGRIEKRYKKNSEEKTEK